LLGFFYNAALNTTDEAGSAITAVVIDNAWVTNIVVAILLVNAVAEAVFGTIITAGVGKTLRNVKKTALVY
jgi:hypothetical protein